MTFNPIKSLTFFFSFSKTFPIFCSLPFLPKFALLINISKTSDQVNRVEEKRKNSTKKSNKKIRNKTAETQSFIFWIIMYKNEVDSKKPKISRIISKKSGKELSISTDSQTSGVLVLRNPLNYPTNRFIIEYHQTHHKIQSLLTKQYITVHRSSNEAGSVMLTLPNCGAESQKLHFKKLQRPNEYIITTFCGLALDCFEEGEKQGTLIVQWHQSGKSHQIWVVEELPNA